MATASVPLRWVMKLPRRLMNGWLRPGAVLLAIASLFCSSFTAISYGAKRPNIVVILVDDMGYGDPECFNPKSKIPTPNINALAQAGMMFTDAHAPGPLCHMSRYGLLTGAIRSARMLPAGLPNR